MTSPGHKHRIVPLEVGKRKPPRHWTISDTRAFESLYPITKNKDLAEMFGRSVDNIRTKAYKMGLKRKKS